MLKEVALQINNFNKTHNVITEINFGRDYLIITMSIPLAKEVREEVPVDTIASSDPSLLWNLLDKMEAQLNRRLS